MHLAQPCHLTTPHGYFTTSELCTYFDSIDIYCITFLEESTYPPSSLLCIVYHVSLILIYTSRQQPNINPFLKVTSSYSHHPRIRVSLVGKIFNFKPRLNQISHPDNARVYLTGRKVKNANVFTQLRKRVQPSTGLECMCQKQQENIPDGLIAVRRAEPCFFKSSPLSQNPKSKIQYLISFFITHSFQHTSTNIIFFLFIPPHCTNVCSLYDVCG